MTQARNTKTRVSPNNKSHMTSPQRAAYSTQSVYGNTQKLKPPTGPSAQTIVNNDYRVQKSNLLVD